MVGVNRNNTSIYLDAGLRATAKELGINVSALVQQALVEEIDKRQQVKRCPTCGTLTPQPTDLPAHFTALHSD